jgi:hypothetical protein
LRHIDSNPSDGRRDEQVAIVVVVIVIVVDRCSERESCVTAPKLAEFHMVHASAPQTVMVDTSSAIAVHLSALSGEWAIGYSFRSR